MVINPEEFFFICEIFSRIHLVSFPFSMRVRKILLFKNFILQVYFQKGCWQVVTEGEDYD